jgi:hypothetical protein
MEAACSAVLKNNLRRNSLHIQDGDTSAGTLQLIAAVCSPALEHPGASCFAKTLTALAAPEDSGSGARKRPSDRFSRYASGADPTMMRSAATAHD